MASHDINDSVHLFVLLDTSASMAGSPIRQLNDGMSDLLNEICYYADRKEVVPLMHILSYGDEPRWLYGTSATHGVSAFQISWHDLPTTSGSNTAAAIEAIIEGLSLQQLGYHSYAPIVVLISDGRSNDPQRTLAAIQKLKNNQLHVIRVAVAPEDYNANELQAFASEGTISLDDELGNLRISYGKMVLPMVRIADAAAIISDLAVGS